MGAYGHREPRSLRRIGLRMRVHERGRGVRQVSSFFFKQLLPSMQPPSNLIGLPFSADGGGMRREVTRGGDEDVRPGRSAFEKLILAERGLDRLDGVEVPIFAEEQLAEHGEQTR